jgi:hypothetical protein
VSGGTATLTNCTVTQNGTGISSTGGVVSLANTLVAGNSADVSGAVSAEHSLIGNSSGATLLPGSANNLLDVGAGLTDLGHYGGPTLTAVLLPDSPAIDAGSNALAVDPVTHQPLAYDQRGMPFPRVSNGTVDIGAVEARLASLVVDTTDDVSDGDYSPGHLSLREAVALADLSPDSNITISFDPTVFATHQTITLTGGQMELSAQVSRVALTGPTAGVTIDGNHQGRVLQVDAGVTASVYRLTITNGNGGSG